jgi:hypothetical protein
MLRASLAMVLVLSLNGCADLTYDSTDGAVADQDGDRCNEGETRCVGQSYQTCPGGWFIEARVCQGSQVCVPKMGCADCDPEGNACVGNTVHLCTAEGKIGAEVKDCLGLVCAAGDCRFPSCAVGADLVYVVDSDHRLLSFDPAAEQGQQFKLIATLSCPGTGLDTPFSMSVDRSARAWVLYTNGEIYWVDTKTGTCASSPFVKGQAGYELFGMGFVSDVAGSSAEKLYIAGAEATIGTGNDKLGYIDPATMKITEVGPVVQAEHSPELTGTGNAELFAYHPGISNTFVAKVSKTDAKVLQQWKVPPLPGQVTAWAFSHWGGKFYIFVTSSPDGFTETSQVLMLDPVTGVAGTYLPSMPYRIVGAGVSTCAPVID